MKIFPHAAGSGFCHAWGAFQFGQIRLADSRNRFEMTQQSFRSRLPDAFNRGQRRGHRCLFSLLPVISNGEPVNFVLDGTDQSKGPAVRTDGDLSPGKGNGPGAVMVILHHTEQRHLYPHLFQ